jgi:hypothetical protein
VEVQTGLVQDKDVPAALLLPSHLLDLAEEKVGHPQQLFVADTSQNVLPGATAKFVNLFELSQLDIVDPLSNPLVPVHAMFVVELDAPQLHVDILVVSVGVAREEVEIKGIDPEPLLEGHERQAQLQNLVVLGHILQLPRYTSTLLYFSKGK